MATRTPERQRSQFRETLVREFYYTPLMATGNPKLSEHDIKRIADLLMRHGTTYCRLQEDACNLEMNDRQQARHDKREKQIEARVTQLCEELGAKPDFQGDPRGHTIKLVVPSGKTDDWGATGICVPTS
jgi:sugar phosphate isomerase/epimerase